MNLKLKELYCLEKGISLSLSLSLSLIPPFPFPFFLDYFISLIYFRAKMIKNKVEVNIELTAGESLVIIQMIMITR